MALYHLLDPFWSRFPWPDRTVLDVKAVGPVRQIRLARQYFGRRMMATHCYLLGDTLVDSGYPAAEKEMLELAREHGVRRLVLTHHHEDHAGNARALAEAGLEVVAGELTCRLLAQDMPLPLYQHVAWGRTWPVRIKPARIKPARIEPVRMEPDRREVVQLGDFEAEVIAAPGHAIDQRVFHVRERGWLFSGDVFIHERVKIFRRDEDFAATLDTLERLVQLDFDTLFCGHRPVTTGGREALGRKLEWLRHLEGEVRRLADAGSGVGEIVKRLRLERSATFRRLSMGDASAHNLVRSILRGPTMRREVAAALADGAT